MIRVTKIRSMTSNAYLVLGERPILVDTGTESSVPGILKAIGQAGISPRDIALIFLTHAHGDHAGGAARLRGLTGAPIAVHRQDADLARTGRNGILRYSRMTSRMWKPIVVHDFDSFEPDILLDGGESIRQWGVTGKVVHLPGHTAGHCALRLDNGEAIVGDVLMGGFMGGMMRAGYPRPHYFYADARNLRESIEAVLGWQEHTLYVGHGGPLRMTDVKARYGDPARSPARSLA